MTTRLLLALLPVLLAGCSAQSDPPAPPVRSWVGTYDLLGTGFPEGDRTARLVISGPDTAYAAILQGPPGHMAEFRPGRDSVVFSWDLEDGEVPFQVRLGRRTGSDSVTGTWSQGINGGQVRGMWRAAP